MAQGSTQPLVKMSTRNIPGGKGGRCVRLTTYHHTLPLSGNLGALTSQTPLFLHGLLRVCFTFTFTFLLYYTNPTIKCRVWTVCRIVTAFSPAFVLKAMTDDPLKPGCEILGVELGNKHIYVSFIIIFFFLVVRQP